MATSLHSHNHDQIIHCGENTALDPTHVLRNSQRGEAATKPKILISCFEFRPFVAKMSFSTGC